MISYSYVYTPQKSRQFNGTISEMIAECNRTGEHLISRNRKHCCWILGFSPNRLIFEKVNGVITRVIEPTLFILTHYKRISEATYIMLTEEISNGTIKFDDLYQYYEVPLWA